MEGPAFPADQGHDALGLTYEEIGATLGVSERTLRRWRNGLNLPRRSQPWKSLWGLIERERRDVRRR